MTTKDYSVKCVERAVTFMTEEALNETSPSLEQIAAASGLSKFHFHRLYALLTGETCTDTMTRLRLARAADTLKDPGVSVTDAAFAAGYSSSQAFAKALKRVLDNSASTLRADPERLGEAIETLAVPKDRDGQDQPELRIEVASLAPFEVIAVRTDSAYPNLNENYWALFEAAGNPELVEAILGQPFDDIATEDLRFDCSLKLSAMPDDLPQGMERRTEQGGLHLLTRHVGAYAGLEDAVDRLYLHALSDDGIEIADQPLRFHYLDDPETTAEADLRTDIYLGIAAA